MANTTITPNMNLPTPVVGQDPGPQYGTDNNSCFNLIDAHDHSSGNGVQITPAGINISTDLSFGGNSATSLKKSVFSSQSAALTGTNFLSFIGGNLYANDGSGNQIPITSGGGVAGSPGSIGSLASPAAATYSAGSKLFTWTADSAKAAAMDNGAVTIRETNVASAKGVTLASASSLAADYQLTLPAALPVSTQYLTSSSSGTITFSTADNIGSAMTSTGANAILGQVTTTKVAYTPTLSMDAGTPTSITATGYYYTVGKLVFATARVSWTQTVSDGANATISLPITPVAMSGINDEAWFISFVSVAGVSNTLNASVSPTIASCGIAFSQKITGSKTAYTNSAVCTVSFGVTYIGV